VVEHTADNRAVTSSSLVGSTWESTLDGGYDGIRGGSIPPLGNDGSIPSSPYLEVWQSGLLQNPAKIPCQVIGTAGSNPATSVLVV
jgi:hypothetical protein